MEMFDRNKIDFKSLKRRKNKVRIDEQDTVTQLVDTAEKEAQESLKLIIRETAATIREAKKKGRKIMTAFGAHTIKNKLYPVLIKLIQENWLDHLATNGAGIIHDWELSYIGETSEDVRENVKSGSFGIWEETGFFINLALAAGAWEGMGYGESVGKMISEGCIYIPDREKLLKKLNSTGLTPDKYAAGWDFYEKIEKFSLTSGKLEINHPFSRCSVQAEAYRLGVPFTGHPMIGHDIIYTHPMNSGSAVGRCAERDFLAYAENVSKLSGGVYISLGSAVMSPMIFEKSLSMSRNTALREKRRIKDFTIFVVDIAESSWDWNSEKEPDQKNPAYYLRYCKTFSRMGGKMNYITADNRHFLPLLYKYLTETCR